MPVDTPLTYVQNPRPVGYPITYRLSGDRLVVDSTRKVDEVRLGAVTQVRLSYEPRSFAQRAYRTKLTLSNGRSVAFSSLSWLSSERRSLKNQPSPSGSLFTSEGSSASA